MKIHITLSLLIAATLASGCKSTTLTEDDDLGTFRGKVMLLGVNYLPLQQQEGASIAIEGTNFTTTSDGKGEWQISNVPAGIYNLIFSKAGFDTTIIIQEFSGAGTAFLESESIQMIPYDSIPFTASFTESDSVQHYIADSMKYVDTVINGIDSSLAELVYYTVYSRDTNRSYSFSIEGNIVGSDSIRHIQVLFYDSRMDSVGAATIAVPTFPSFTILSSSIPWTTFEALQPIHKGESIYISIRALAEGCCENGSYGGAVSPYIVYRNIIVQ
jgi:hypothetical protein